MLIVYSKVNAQTIFKGVKIGMQLKVKLYSKEFEK